MQPDRPQQFPFSLLSLILGIASIPLVFCFTLGLPTGAVAIVLGVLGLRNANRGGSANRTQAIVGIACGAAAVLLLIILIALPDS